MSHAMKAAHVRKLALIAIASVALLTVAVSFATAQPPRGGLRDALRACVAEKRASHYAPRPFESPELTLTCPGADLVGFPPREQRHERNELVSYAASEGYRIVPGSASLCAVPEGAAAPPVTVSPDNLLAQTPLSCRGGGIGAAAISVAARICGQERRTEAPEMERTWLFECAQGLSRGR